MQDTIKTSGSNITNLNKQISFCSRILSYYVLHIQLLENYQGMEK